MSFSGRGGEAPCGWPRVVVQDGIAEKEPPPPSTIRHVCTARESPPRLAAARVCNSSRRKCAISMVLTPATGRVDRGPDATPNTGPLRAYARSSPSAQRILHMAHGRHGGVRLTATPQLSSDIPHRSELPDQPGLPTRTSLFDAILQ